MPVTLPFDVLAAAMIVALTKNNINMIFFIVMYFVMFRRYSVRVDGVSPTRAEPVNRSPIVTTGPVLLLKVIRAKEMGNRLVAHFLMLVHAAPPNFHQRNPPRDP